MSATTAELLKTMEILGNQARQAPPAEKKTLLQRIDEIAAVIAQRGRAHNLIFMNEICWSHTLTTQG
jgi:hypothetical protein